MVKKWQKFHLEKASSSPTHETDSHCVHEVKNCRVDHNVWDKNPITYMSAHLAAPGHRKNQK